MIACQIARPRNATRVALMSRLGWETVNTTTAAFVLLSLCSILFGSPVEAKSAPLLTLIFIAIFVLLTLSVSGLGHATLLVIQKWATYVFGALNILVGGFLCATIDWSAVFNATPQVASPAASNMHSAPWACRSRMRTCSS